MTIRSPGLRLPPGYFLLLLSALCAVALYSRPACGGVADPLISGPALDSLLRTPPCLEGYRSNQSGPLTRIDPIAGDRIDTTFTVEELDVPSDGLRIHGWLYLPKRDGRFPLIILTNGGGDDPVRTRSLSDWVAPILAHCGYAALVHDKRGTGRSEGDFAATTYDDYVRDAGNCALFLSKHPRIDPDAIGVLGGSEGGRIAVLTASRFPVVRFAISFAGTVVSALDDRLHAQMGWLRGVAGSDSVFAAVAPLWDRSLRAWAGRDPAEHEKVEAEIAAMRKRFDRNVLPCPRAEMESIPEFRRVLPTWHSLPNDYLAELEHFTKPWLAIFGAADIVVPTEASIANIRRLMARSGNSEYEVAVIPNCGHAPVDVETKQLIPIDHLVINWLGEKVGR